MKRLLAAFVALGILAGTAGAAVAKDRSDKPAPAPVAAVAAAATDQVPVTPVRWYYYGPRWYGGAYYAPYTYYYGPEYVYPGWGTYYYPGFGFGYYGPRRAFRFGF